MISDQEMYKHVTKPVSASIIFDSDDGMMAATKYAEWAKELNTEHRKPFRVQTILNEVPRFKESTQPSNIIWRNRHIKGVKYGMRVFAAILIAFLMLMFAFSFIFMFNKASIRVQKKWPVVDCDVLKKPYSDAEIKIAAGNEYKEILRTKGTGNMIGALKCFCKDEIVKLGGVTKVYDLKTKTYPVDFSGKTKNVPICDPYVDGYLEKTFLINLFKYLIIIMNKVITLACLYIIMICGCSAESTEMIYTTNVIFVCIFFNTGILPMICTANF